MVEVREEVEMNGVGGVQGRLYAVVEDITPEIAREYLALNEENRALKKSFVNKLTGAILRGEWIFNGESIKFDASGKLIDGQHRLAAVVAAEETVPMLVVRNAPAGSQDTVDTGTRRTLSDALRIRSEKNNSVLAAAIAWMHRIQNSKTASVMAGQSYPTIQQGLALLAENPGLRESKSTAYALYHNLRVPQGLGQALHYVLSSLDAQDADVFFDYLITGVGLEEGDPILTLRRSLTRIMQQAARSRGVGQAYMAAIIIRAWNAYRDGRPLARLQWSPGGSRKEAFPAPR